MRGKKPSQRYSGPQDVYARHLVSYRGYPLWTPELKIQLPQDYQDEGLKIGDVGYVVPGKGSFEVLFNILLPFDHDLHRGKRLPRKFRPITDEVDISTYTDIEDAGCVISTSSVKTVEVSPVEQPSDYKFTLSSNEGALLILPQGADEHSLQSDRLFGEYAKQHAAEWYRFVEEDLKRTIAYDSLYLITGFYKARSFALASFQEAEGSGDLPVQFKVKQTERGGIVRSSGWTTARALNKRVGPRKYNGNPNQAVYISGFKVAVRDEPAGRKQVTVKVDNYPSTEPRHEDFTDIVDSQEPDDNGKSTESTSQGSSTNQGTQGIIRHASLQRMPHVSQPFHPSDIINQYLLQKEPYATVAITHDSQWATLLKTTKGRLEPHELAEERLILDVLSEQYASVGVAFLQSAKSAKDTWISGVKGQSRAQQDDNGDRVDKEELVTAMRPVVLSKLSRSHNTGVTLSSDIAIPSGDPMHHQTMAIDSSENIKSVNTHWHPELPDLTLAISRVPNRCEEGGAFSDVYRCWYDRRSGSKEVALKVFRFKIPLKNEANVRLAKRRNRELETWKCLSHENILPFLGIARGYGRGGVSLVSPWMQNGCLHQFLERHDETLSVAHRLQLLLDIANGLHYLHNFDLTPVVHGNLIPANILLDENYTARLAGFGNSCVLGSIGSLSPGYEMTRPLSALRWTSPELLEEPVAYQVSTKSDIYPFGCLSLQTLSGKPPWSEVRQDAVVVLCLAKGERPGRPASEHLDDGHWKFIQRCWLSDPDRRPSSEVVVRSVRLFLKHHSSDPRPLCESLPFASSSSSSGDQAQMTAFGGASTSSSVLASSCASTAAFERTSGR